MRKLFYAIVLAAIALSFASCANEDTARGIDIEDTFQSTATITGVALMNVNTSGTTIEQFVPAGTELVFSIDHSEYGVGAAPAPVLVRAAATGSYVKSTTVGEDGFYEITLPTREDGVAVEVNIEGNPVVVSVDMDGVQTEQVFEVKRGTSLSVMKGLSYPKNIMYVCSDTILENVDWQEGTYKATLVYFNGKEEIAVPEGTEVKVTIEGDQFTPKRENDLVMIEKVGANGVFEIKMQAPSLIYGGITVKSIESTFVADSIVINSGVESVLKCSFTLNTNGMIYGGLVNNAGMIACTQKDVLESEDILATWKNATYKVNFVYDNNESTDTNYYVAIPSDVNIVVTEKRSAVDTRLKDVIKIMKYSEFVKGYTTLAPDPALVALTEGLPISIEMDFIADVITDVDADDNAIMSQYKFSVLIDKKPNVLVAPTPIKLLGGIPFNGGVEYSYADGTKVENILILSGTQIQ